MKYYIFSYFIIKICVYVYNLHKNIYIICSFVKPYTKPEIKILSYNIQRIPLYFRPNIDVKYLFEKTESDIICLQEDFTQISQSNLYINDEISIIRPSVSKYYKLANSGLTIYSKLKINNSIFIPFNSASYEEKIADKGFLIVELDNLILINTHLQYGDNKCADKQINYIISYIKNNYKSNRRIAIVGDFNIDLRNITIPYFDKIIPTTPTHYSSKKNPKFNTLASLENLSISEKNNYDPNYIDGGFYSNLKLKSVNYDILDKYADHMAIIISLLYN